ncbi:MAG TPA: hypothetical protein VH414_20840 [Lichenihabitans sp.]|jgi:hypothetical protein|nr:hypothetical protein [Lichenihabitans sp.]
MSKLFIRTAGALLMAAASTVAWAGGHGGHGGPMMMHPGGFHGGGHWGGSGFHAMPPVAGTIHVRPNGGNFFSAYGHTNTAFGHRAVPSFYGHVGTALRGRAGLERRELVGRRFDRSDRFAFDHRGFRFARDFRHRRVIGGGFGGYGADLSAAPTYGGYAEAPLASSYVEAPLDQGYDGGYGGYSSGAGYAGGPQIIVVNSNCPGASRRAHDCGCGQDARPSPVVYRFGVGSYY